MACHVKNTFCVLPGHGFVMKIGDFGMSRHITLAKRPNGTNVLARQLTSGPHWERIMHKVILCRYNK